MINHVEGNILESGADYLVCPVNVVGTLGAGLAKQYKDTFPFLDYEYQIALRNGDLTIKQVSLVPIGDGREIVLFPTKFHWKDKSSLIWIQGNMTDLRLLLEKRPSFRIAMPPVGCGLGGLDTSDVFDIVKQLDRDGITIDAYGFR